MSIEDLQKAYESLPPKPEGFSEIKIIKSPIVKDGNPILMLSENDFKWYTKNLETHETNNRARNF